MATIGPRMDGVSRRPLGAPATGIGSGYLRAAVWWGPARWLADDPTDLERAPRPGYRTRAITRGQLERMFAALSPATGANPLWRLLYEDRRSRKRAAVSWTDDLDLATAGRGAKQGGASSGVWQTGAPLLQPLAEDRRTSSWVPPARPASRHRPGSASGRAAVVQAGRRLFACATGGAASVRHGPHSRRRDGTNLPLRLARPARIVRSLER